MGTLAIPAHLLEGHHRRPLCPAARQALVLNFLMSFDSVLRPYCTVLPFYRGEDEDIESHLLKVIQLISDRAET